MRVKEINLGNGLSRLEVDDCFGRTLPTHVVDEIMRDIVARKRREGTRGVQTSASCECCGRSTMTSRSPFTMGSTTISRNPFMNRREDTPFRDTLREPDGIDIHVDRPRREIFCTHREWAEAMAKYRTLEDVAKDCDWPCKEPMKGFEETAPRFPWMENKDFPSLDEEFEDEWDDDDDFESPFMRIEIRF